MDSLLNSKYISKNQIDRIRKSMYQCFFLLKSIFTNDDKECEIRLTGSTLNVYKITIKDCIFNCDCPDFIYSDRNNMYCKHICFVICYIGKIRDEQLFIKRALTEENKKQIFSRLTSINVIDNNDDNIICKTLTDKYNSINDNESSVIDPRNIDDDCAICFLPLNPCENNICENDKIKASKFLEISNLEDEKTIEKDILETNSIYPPLTTCVECSNAIHSTCLETWLKYNKTCVFCRQSWKCNPKIRNGYVNIS